jgi:hypothetical protein
MRAPKERQQRARSRPHSAHTQEAKEADGFLVEGADGADAKKRMSAALSLATGAVFKKMRSQPAFSQLSS